MSVSNQCCYVYSLFEFRVLFFILQYKQQHWLCCLPTLPVIGHWGSGPFHGVKQLEREIYHSSISNAKVKKKWSYAPLPPICLHNVSWVNFAFTLIFVNFFSWSDNCNVSFGVRIVFSSFGEGFYEMK
jgi:hypothetical protein